ncbi:MAG: nucleoside-diphosphate-sugar epimerase/acyl carrier protein [Candidatus Poriferisodalaceae bacterium]
MHVLPSIAELTGAGGGVAAKDIRYITPADLLGRRPVDLDLHVRGRYVRNEVVLVTGAGGSIGSELCRQLAKLGTENLLMLDSDSLIVADIRDEQRVHDIFDKYRPTVVFHAAALKHLTLLESYSAEAAKTNVVGTQALLGLAEEFGVQTFMNVSTDKAADASSVLGYTKRLAERLTADAAALSGHQFMSVRFGNVLGSRGSVLTAFAKQIEAGGPVSVTHPDIDRFFMTVEEAVGLVIAAGDIGRQGEVMILEMGDPVRILDVANHMIAMSGRDIDIEFTGLSEGEKMHEEYAGRDEPIVMDDDQLMWHGTCPPVAWAEISHLVEFGDDRELRAELHRIAGAAHLQAVRPITTFLSPSDVTNVERAALLSAFDSGSVAPAGPPSTRSNATSVIVVAVDATDQPAMTAAIADIEARLGPIDGVIVAAAVADNEGAIARRTHEAAEAAISAKVYGSVALAGALAEATGGRELDFVLLSSSIASQLFHNRFGQVGYVTSNSFVEAMAETNAFNANRVVRVAWDDWVDIAMSVRAAQEFRERHGDSIELMDELHSFTPADGIELLHRAISVDHSTLFVSTTDLRRRVDTDHLVSNPFLEQALAADDGGGTLEGSLDEVVLDIWRSLLGVNDIEADADFFDLGGDSLQVARMVDRLRRHLGFEISLDLVFEHPTPSSLTAALAELDGTGIEDDRPLEIVGTQPLAAAQRRFLERKSPFPSHFNVAAWLEATPPVPAEDFISAAQLLVARHDGLRTRFVRTEGEPGWSQHVAAADALGNAAPETVALDTVVLGGEDATASELAEQWQTEFDIESGPLARFAHVTLPDGTQRLFVGMHHLTYDRLSLLGLIDELDEILASGTDEGLGRGTLPFSAWRSAIEAHVTSANMDAEVERWNAVPDPGPVNWPGSLDAPNTNHLGSDRKIVLDSTSSAVLLRSGVARADELVLLALADAVREWSDNSVLGIDVLGHGRRHVPGVDVARSVGFFLSYSPVWFSDRSDDPVSGRVEELRSSVDAAWSFDAPRCHRPSSGTLRDRGSCRTSWDVPSLAASLNS